MKQKVVFFVLILLSAVTLRFFRLGNDGHPLLWDEAANGYNAYSLLSTARDEYGTFLPPVLKSFGDYKPALTAYLTIPSVAIFGLTEFAVRLPSAVFGVLIVVMIFLTTNELFPGYNISVGKVKLSDGFFAALVASFNPWLVHFSRGGWEANVCLGLTLAGIWSFLRSRRQPLFLLLSATAFGLTFLTYQGAKLFTPLIILVLITLYGRKIFAVKPRILFISGATLVALAAPIFLNLLTTGSRLGILNVFSYLSPDQLAIASREERIGGSSTPLDLFHGAWLAQMRRILEGYFNHFSGRFLFYEGDWNDGRLGSPYVGQFYWPDLFFITVGLVTIIRRKEQRELCLLALWLGISPLPAAFSRDVIHALRSYNLAAPLIILAGIGVQTAVSFLVKLPRSVGISLAGLLLIAYSWDVAYYLDSYYVQAPIISARDWLYGYKEAVTAIKEINPANLPVYLTQKMGQPYIFVLFYDKVDPRLYQTQAYLKENPGGDVGEVDRFANFHFRDLYWPADRGLRSSFFIGTQDELPTKDIDPRQAAIVKDIVRPDGSVALRIVKTF